MITKEKQITVQEFRELMKAQNIVESGSETMNLFYQYSQQALKITMEINNKYPRNTSILAAASATAITPSDCVIFLKNPAIK